MKKNHVKLISSMLFALCMVVVGVLLVVVRAKAEEQVVLPDVKYEAGVLYNKDNEAPTTVPTGYLFAGWYENIGTEEAPNYSPVKEPTLGVKYVAKYVPAQMLGIRAQVTKKIITNTDIDNLKNNSIRFVTSLDSTNYKDIGFDISIGGVTQDTEKYKTNIVYKVIYAIGATNTNDPWEYKPSEVFENAASQFFKTYTFTEVPEVGFDTDIVVTPYYITYDGTKVYGTQTIRTVNYCRAWVYVDSTSAATEIGTHNSPFQTIEAAVAMMDEKTTQKIGLNPKVILKSDIQLNSEVCVDKSLTLTSQGERKTISRPATMKTGNAMVYAKNTNQSIVVTVDNIRFDGTGTETNIRALAVGTESADETLNINNTLIENFTSSKQGGSLMVRGTVNLTNSIIQNGSSTIEGGLVCVSSGKFTMNGGKIIGGTSDTLGGNIYVYAGTFEMTDSTVQDGESKNNGGNIYVAGTTTYQCGVTINDSKIIDGKANSSTNDNAHGTGGNIYIDYTKLDVTGTVITGGQALNSRGGNVYVKSESTLNLNEGSVVEEGYSLENGGNIMLNQTSRLNVKGGTVQNGKSENQRGGNVYVSTDSRVIVHNGYFLNGISNNEGANIYLTSTASMIFEGGEVQITGGKTNNGKESNLYLLSGKTVTIKGALTGDTSIGVTQFDGEGILATGTGVSESCTAYFFADAEEKEMIYNQSDETLSSAFLHKYTAVDYINNPELFVPVWASERTVSEEMLNFEEKYEQFFTPSGRLMSVAHRGDWKHYPENSAEAFLSAIMLGADIIEVDLAITKDGHIVLMHDGETSSGGTLTRTTNVAIARKNNPELPDSDNVRDWTLEELRQLRLRQGYGENSAPVTSCIIPTLEEIIQLCNNRVFITLDKVGRLSLLDTYYGKSLSSSARWSTYIMPLLKKYNAYRTVMLPYTYTHVSASSTNYSAVYNEASTIMTNIYGESGVTSALMSRVEFATQLETVMGYVKKYNFPRVLRSGEYSEEDYETYYKNSECFSNFRVHIECLKGNDYLEMWQQIESQGYGIIVTNDICGLTEYIQEKEFKSVQVSPSPLPKPGDDSQTWP